MDLFSIAGALRARGLAEEGIFAALQGLNLTAVDPPLSEREIRDMAKGITRYPPGELPVLALAQANSKHSAGPDTASNSPEFTPLGDLLDESEEETDWLVDGLLPAGGFAIACAKPKVGKSVFARDLAFCVARGEPFLGHATVQGAALVLSLEEKRSAIRKHFRQMGAKGDEPILVHAAKAPEQALAWLERATRRHKPVLIVIDTLQRLVRLPDLNDYAPVMNALEPILNLSRESGACILATHHSKKATGADSGDNVMGSQALFATADTLIELRRNEGGRRTIECVQRYGDDMEQSVLVLNPETGRVHVEGSKEAADQVDAAQRILAFLSPEKDGDEADWFDRELLLNGVEGRLSTKRVALKNLLEQGLVNRKGAGTRGDKHRYQVSRPLGPAPSLDQGTAHENEGGFSLVEATNTWSQDLPSSAETPKTRDQESTLVEHRVPETPAA
jgi:AAA domain/Primase C terminal 1 (PriCT-1)